MDFKLIEQLLNLPRVHVSRIDFGEDEICIWLNISSSQHKCPRCGKFTSTVTEERIVKVRDLPIFGKRCYLQIRKGRLHCECSYRGYEALDFVDSHQRQTNRFNEFLFSLCDHMTIMDASDLAFVDWKKAYRTDRQVLELLKVDTPLPSMRVIGVDEISFEKYHRYFTIVYDISGDAGVLFVGKDRTSESLNGFFEQLSPEQIKSIQVVSMDMWDPYIKSIRENLPDADIVFDRFHLKKHLNQCIDQLRRSLVAQGSTQEKRLIKDKRWVLLKKAVNHNEKDKKRLQELKEINSPLYEAYLAKEQFDQFWTLKSPSEATIFLNDWFAELSSSLANAFEPFFKMIKKYISGILTYFKHGVTNAKAEGFNNKIKVLKRSAYGYRDQTYFQLKILRRCGYLKYAKPAF
jgi:transposase